MAPSSRHDDVEVVPGIYLTNELRLYEVVEVSDSRICVRNIVTEIQFWFPREATRSWRVVLPECPDSVDSLT